MSGEVAIRQDDHVHAVQTPKIDGRISVDLDGHPDDAPALTVPPEVRVEYADEDARDEMATDGGLTATSRTEIEMRGFSLGEEATGFGLFASFLLLSGGGWLLSTAHEGMAIVAVLSGVLLGYVATGSYWRRP